MASGLYTLVMNTIITIPATATADIMRNNQVDCWPEVLGHMRGPIDNKPFCAAIWRTQIIRLIFYLRRMARCHFEYKKEQVSKQR